MRAFTFGAVLLTLAVLASQEPIERRDFTGSLLDTDTAKPKREKIGIKAELAELNEYLEDVPIQNMQAVKHLVKLLKSIDEAAQQLDCNIYEEIAEPKLPEKLELPQTKSSDVEADTENQKNAAQQHFSDNEEASRRSFDSNRLFIPPIENSNTQSPWCSVAMSCRKTMNSICGYEDNFGYGKFDDMCHMLQVNCYFKYNFALVPSCKPFL
ncbi:uncharacterized protein LOC123663999 [Melitaea cinxia]|uniref:uncharacterized protein LOC123663999 n=1 Tax=Melitaea cinxia TaxID=113334 RepID=UPI001E2727C2|nr:uncharacterized protein LOC123663999 [Melitaea cinxia]